MAPVTTFLKHWLDNGEVIPLTTNAIESAFSRVNNRIKRVGRGLVGARSTELTEGDLPQDIQTGALVNALEQREEFSQDQTDIA